MIVGLGKAALVALSGLQKYSEHMQKIRDYFEEKLKVSDGIHFLWLSNPISSRIDIAPVFNFPSDVTTR